MNINQLVDLLAQHIANGHGDADVLIGMSRLVDVAGDAALNRLSRHNWTVARVADETADRFVVLDLEVES